MAIRPTDVRRREFRKGFRGYDANQVDDFLDAVADEFERAHTENSRLRERLRQLEELEDSIRAALVHAEQPADVVRRSPKNRKDDPTIHEARLEGVQESYEAPEPEDAGKAEPSDTGVVAEAVPAEAVVAEAVVAEGEPIPEPGSELAELEVAEEAPPTSLYRKVLWAGRGTVQRIERPMRRVAKKSPTLVKARDEVVRRYHGALMRGAGPRKRKPKRRGSGPNPANMVWIFCTSRSGSTWLRSMMAEIEGHKVWEEPSVGRLFGEFYRKAQKRQLASPHFILGNPTRQGWISLIRNFILDGVQYAHPFLNSGHYLVIKEPDSAAGAPLIMQALPESRMIFLIRDPRDVAASALDAARKGSWMYEVLDKAAWRQKAQADKKPDNFVRARANSYLNLVGSIKEAYDAHKGRKALVRYEDLRADTLGEMKRVYSVLGIPVNEAALARAVEKHSWESIPEKEKGAGKFYRKGTPGGWKEDLTPDQVRIVEDITAPLLKEFYP